MSKESWIKEKEDQREFWEKEIFSMAEYTKPHYIELQDIEKAYETLFQVLSDEVVEQIYEDNREIFNELSRRLEQ